MLVNRRRRRFEIVQQNNSLFRRDELVARGSAKLAHYLLIVLQVQWVLWFHLREFLLEIAGAWQLSSLHAGMSQQFHHFADVGGLPCFVEQVEKLLERIWVVANVPDDRVQAL